MSQDRSVTFSPDVELNDSQWEEYKSIKAEQDQLLSQQVKLVILYSNLCVLASEENEINQNAVSYPQALCEPHEIKYFPEREELTYHNFDTKMQLVVDDNQKLQHSNIILLHDCTRMLSYLISINKKFDSPENRTLIKTNLILVGKFFKKDCFDEKKENDIKKNERHPRLF